MYKLSCPKCESLEVRVIPTWYMHVDEDGHKIPKHKTAIQCSKCLKEDEYKNIQEWQIRPIEGSFLAVANYCIKHNEKINLGGN